MVASDKTAQTKQGRCATPVNSLPNSLMVMHLKIKPSKQLSQKGAECPKGQTGKLKREGIKIALNT